MLAAISLALGCHKQADSCCSRLNVASVSDCLLCCVWLFLATSVQQPWASGTSSVFCVLAISHLTLYKLSSVAVGKVWMVDIS